MASLDRLAKTRVWVHSCAHDHLLVQAGISPRMLAVRALKMPGSFVGIRAVLFALVDDGRQDSNNYLTKMHTRPSWRPYAKLAIIVWIACITGGSIHQTVSIVKFFVLGYYIFIMITLALALVLLLSLLGLYLTNAQSLVQTNTPRTAR